MRFNKQELYALASQTSPNFDREGVLVMKERQDGFFRRSEGCVVRWCRLRGNLLFYLKGPEAWYEPMGVVVLGRHQVKVQTKDENGHWPFHIVWENGVCYRMATFHESERTLWLKAIQLAPYDRIHEQLNALREKLNTLSPAVDIGTYRLQKGVVIDMNEIPLCELAVSCDNLMCDAYGRPPSPKVVVYVQNSKGKCIKYATTETIEMCSNPCFSKTILFWSSDGLTEDSSVRLMVYDVKELASEVALPMGFTNLKLSAIQEAQRLRVALLTHEDMTIGFVTMNGWNLVPSCLEVSPCHAHDRQCIDIPHKLLLSHRRAQSLPPKLGVNLKYPSYGNLIYQNMANGFQATYRFHSGLGGDITVHEIMAEAKLSFYMPVQLLNIFIKREKEMLDELLCIGEVGHWRNKQEDMVNAHLTLLKHYFYCKQSTLKPHRVFYKSSDRKGDPSLEFVPVNLHLQRMWVHNDTLNKSGYHDIITVGAFSAHTHQNEKPGGLIKLVQQVKDINSFKAEMNSIGNKIQAEYDNVIAVRRLREELIVDMEKSIMLMQAKQPKNVETVVEHIKEKVKSILTLWEPSSVEQSLSYVGWPDNSCQEVETSEAITSMLKLTEQLAVTEPTKTEKAAPVPSTSSVTYNGITPILIDETGRPLVIYSTNNNDGNSFKNDTIEEKDESQEANVITVEAELHFNEDYFKKKDDMKRSNSSILSSLQPLNSSSSEKSQSSDSEKPKQASLQQASVSFEQVSYKSLVDSLGDDDSAKQSEARALDTSNSSDTDKAIARENNVAYLKGLAATVEGSIQQYIDDLNKAVTGGNDLSTEENLEIVKRRVDEVKASTEAIAHWLRVSHAALRLRYESSTWAREHAALQTRRDSCFSQALTTLTTGLVCWLNSIPNDVVVKLLSNGLGPLCGFEGLLSLYSTETTMWGDMVVAIEDMQTVLFTLIKEVHGAALLPRVTGTRGSITVLVPIPDQLFVRFTQKEHLSFNVTAVFFNIGINDKATLAETLGETVPQYQSNCDNLDRLQKYYHNYSKVFPNELISAMRVSTRTKPLEEVMEMLKIAVQKKVPRNTEVLHLAAMATRLMNGIRFTSCKSAKDRTGMSVTLEQCSVLSSEYHLAEHETQKALDIMRSEGCRRQNAFKNIGVRKYAFTKTQVMALPALYRPPTGSYGALHT